MSSKPASWLTCWQRICNCNAVKIYDRLVNDPRPLPFAPEVWSVPSEPLHDDTTPEGLAAVIAQHNEKHGPNGEHNPDCGCLTTDQLPMSDERLNEIADRTVLTLSAPWEVGDGYRSEGIGIYAVGMEIANVQETLPEIAAFIAAARTDIPDLIAEVRRLREMQAELVERGPFVDHDARSGVYRCADCDVDVHDDAGEIAPPRTHKETCLWWQAQEGRRVAESVGKYPFPS